MLGSEYWLTDKRPVPYRCISDDDDDDHDNDDDDDDDDLAAVVYRRCRQVSIGVTEFSD